MAAADILDFHGYVPSRRQSRVSELYTERGSNIIGLHAEYQGLH